MPTQSYISKFRDEFIAHITLGRCPLKKPEAHQHAA
jgi:hypothetical protein